MCGTKSKLSLVMGTCAPSTFVRKSSAKSGFVPRLARVVGSAFETSNKIEASTFKELLLTTQGASPTLKPLYYQDSGRSPSYGAFY